MAQKRKFVEGFTFVVHLNFDTFLDCGNVRENRVRHHKGLDDIYPMQLLHHNTVAISHPPVAQDNHKAGAARCLPT